ncbi:MAG: SDR family NAD(P)-dependent oxidoreductase [Desulfuromonadales bacterium]|nr:SDR family NAD(P)-dependent oxidoreductase [Desulfuromonadales bacterium]MBN2793360.1 SDR family NAD(P)-dependent oxidoreductase [Desulfuromonadales bacterium]
MKVLITGATSGIGRQLAQDYRRDGHQVWAVGRSQVELDQLEAQGISTLCLDLLDRQATVDGLAFLQSLDLAILSAGSCEYIDIPDFDSALLARVMRINVETMAHSIEGLLPALKKGTAPRLVGIGSSAAYLPLPRAEAYGASKAAIAYLINTLRVTLEPEGVAVSLVCPGFVKTPLTDRNDFPMPFLVSVEEASRAIRTGIAKGRAEIHFPKIFTMAMKSLALLPEPLWRRIARRMINA